MTTFRIDKNLMDDYINSLDKRRTIVFVIATLVVLSIQAFIAYNIDSDFPFWVLIVATAVIAVAFYFSLRLSNDTLRQLADGQFYIDNSVLKFVATDSLTRQFNLDQIAVIHKKYSGTIVVKGNGWTKFNYIRPKRTNFYQVGGLDVIFIPTITSNYSDLLDTVMQTSKNAIRL